MAVHNIGFIHLFCGKVVSHEEFLEIRRRMTEVLSDSYSNHDFQMFMSVITHAITCKECSREFYQSISKAKHHLNSELK
jgi:hypothetical protein